MVSWEFKHVLLFLTVRSRFHISLAEEEHNREFIQLLRLLEHLHNNAVVFEAKLLKRPALGVTVDFSEVSVVQFVA